MKQIKHPLPWNVSKHTSRALTKFWFVYDAKQSIVTVFNTEDQAKLCVEQANALGAKIKKEKIKQYVKAAIIIGTVVFSIFLLYMII